LSLRRAVEQACGAVEQACSAVEQACSAVERNCTRQPVPALDSLTLLGRYPAGQALLDRLAQRAHDGAVSGGSAGPNALVVLL
jgi:hypothetical protein